MTNEAIQRMFDHLTQLTNIRLDQHFRMTFLFRVDYLRFIGLFSQRSSRMHQFLEALEEGAVQLDRMKMGASISSVVGSSVSFAGGIVSIVGLALAPLMAGASLIFMLVSTGLALTSGVNSLATGVAEMLVNSHHEKKVNKVFQSYMENVVTILEGLEQAASRDIPNIESDLLDVGVRVVCLAKNVYKKVKVIVDSTAAKNIPNGEAHLTDFRKLAKGKPLAFFKSAWMKSIGVNSIFMGMDVFICKDSISLAKGSKSDVSKVIRLRASLWKTELDAWERIHHSLCIGKLMFSESMEVLERSFYS